MAQDLFDKYYITIHSSQSLTTTGDTIDFKIEADTIYLEKTLNHLDQLTIDFASILNDLDIAYTIVSGYLAILFGRNRASEDIDIFIERIERGTFDKLWQKAQDQFECIITSDPEEAYSYYLAENYAIRFARRNTIIPNIEMKFPKTNAAAWAIGNRVRVILNDEVLYISPLELQIAYKLFLGSDKDIEDAKYLYIIFKEIVDMNTLMHFLAEYNQLEVFRRDIDTLAED